VSGAFAFPIFVEVRGRRVLVVGDGHEARAKRQALTELDAQVVAPDPAEPIDPAVVDGAVLAIVATGDRARDREVAALVRSRGVLVNTVDDVDYCDWSAPAILRRGDLTVAVATGGIAPALAVRLRDRFATELGPEIAGLVELFGEVRPAIMATGRPFADRRALWYRLVDGPALEHLRAGRVEQAREAIAAEVAAWEAAG
jgi:precorrin-2 dehydrogenase/sirohydrochlorin ferrochelatase